MNAKISKNRVPWQLLLGLVLMLGSSSVALAKASTAAGNYYTAADKEFYLTADEIFFIRPGLVLEILDVTIPADRQLEVTFKLSDPGGLALDRNGITTPGPVSTSFILSYIPEGEEAYVAYTTRVQKSPITGVSVTQGSTDAGGVYTDLGGGQYLYKFKTVLPADYDVDATHTLGMYARRDLTEFDLDRYVDNELEHFVPSGTVEPEPRDIVKTETCNGRCHDPLALHGGARTEVGLCVLCHNPDATDEARRPPEARTTSRSATSPASRTTASTCSATPTSAIARRGTTRTRCTCGCAGSTSGSTRARLSPSGNGPGATAPSSASTRSRSTGTSRAGSSSTSRATRASRFPPTAI